MAVSPLGNLDRGELGTLYAIARILNSTLDLDQVLRMVMDRVIEFVEADRGFLMLVNQETNELEFKIAHDNQGRTINRREFERNKKGISLSTVHQVVNNRRLITDADLTDPTRSMLDYDIRSVMCAPLLVRNNCIGAVYVDRQAITSAIANQFGPKHRDLLLAFCHQAAIAIDNARLFASVNEERQYKDNIFASIANGVITTNSSGIITTFNPAAGTILNLDPHEAIGKHYQKVFSERPEVGLIELLQRAQVEHGTVIPDAVVCEIPERPGPIYLNLYVSSLRDAQNADIGMALVVDDRTEIKRREAEAREIRRIFRSYVHPSVVDYLIQHPEMLNLGGETKEITVIFADIRGSTRLGENMEPEKVMNLYNSYLKIMVEKIWEEEGTVTTFMGDGLMAIFNAPLPQSSHALRAVCAAWKMSLAVVEYQRLHPQEIPISFGFGVNTGEAVVGNIGSEGRMQNYTAIGDVINVASRLQSHVSDNKILLNESTWKQVDHSVNAGESFSLVVRNRTMPVEVRYMIGLKN